MPLSQRLIRFFTLIGGVYFFLKFLLPREFDLPGVGTVTFGKYHEQISVGLTALVSMSVGLGLGNMLFGHGKVVVYLRQGWVFSSALLLGLASMLVLSGLEWRSTRAQSSAAEEIFLLRDFALRIKEDAESKEPLSVGLIKPVEERNLILVESTARKLDELAALDGNGAESAEWKTLLTSVKAANDALRRSPGVESEFALNQALAAKLGELGAARGRLQAEPGVQQGLYRILFNGLFVSLGSAMFALLGFYIASAAYRAFRIRSVESALMMSAAVIVILGQIPLAIFGYSDFGQRLQSIFPVVRQWLLTVPNSAAFRAIELGASIGALVMAFRMWFSIESSSFGKQEKK